VGFTIPYTLNGQEWNYVPDFVVRLRTAAGDVNLIIEVTGEKRTDKETKVATARTLWVPAVNNHCAFGPVGVCGDWRPVGCKNADLSRRQRCGGGGGRMKAEYDEVGLWSEMKLEIVRDYAKEYSKIISKRKLTHVYIDAFAGAGMHFSKTTGEYIPGSPLNALMVTELLRHTEELKQNPSEWMPWNYRDTLTRLARPTAA